MTRVWDEIAKPIGASKRIQVKSKEQGKEGRREGRSPFLVIGFRLVIAHTLLVAICLQCPVHMRGKCAAMHCCWKQHWVSLLL